MRKLTFSTIAAIAAVSVISIAPVGAHHSFAMFDLSQHKMIEGRVTDWHYNNPHSWLHIEAPGEDGATQTWSFEGAARVHAARQGVDGTTFRKGERVKVVMSPIRDGRRAGAMCFVVKEDGSVARPNDGTCNAPAVIESWRTNGWLESAGHLEVHPAGE